MNNLKILLEELEKLKLIDEDEKNTAILKYFENQDDNSFIIEDIEYILLCTAEVKELLYAQYEDEFYDFIEWAGDYGGMPFANFIDEVDTISNMVSAFYFQSLNGYKFVSISSSNDLFIYIKD